MSQHTPGPWVACKHGKGFLVGSAGGGVSFQIRPRDAGTADEQFVADVRLCRAAPDLLAALKAVVAIADRATVEFDAARAAIAKAEGRE